jgi:hypothetical protein
VHRRKPSSSLSKVFVRRHLTIVTRDLSARLGPTAQGIRVSSEKSLSPVSAIAKGAIPHQTAESSGVACHTTVPEKLYEVVRPVDRPRTLVQTVQRAPPTPYCFRKISHTTCAADRPLWMLTNYGVDSHGFGPTQRCFWQRTISEYPKNIRRHGIRV